MSVCVPMCQWQFNKFINISFSYVKLATAAGAGAVTSIEKARKLRKFHWIVVPEVLSLTHSVSVSFPFTVGAAMQIIQ